MEKEDFINYTLKCLKKIGLNPNIKQAENTYLFYEELIEWNKKINLTTITSPKDFIDKHVLDSLYLLKILKDKNLNIIDAGSGAGLPGLILKIYSSHMNVTSVESVFKKCNFQKAVARKLGLTGFECINANIYSFKNYNKIDAIVSRAAFNIDEFIHLIDKINLKNNTMVLLYLTDFNEVNKIGNYKFKNKKLYIDKILRYKINNTNYRLIVLFKILTFFA